MSEFCEYLVAGGESWRVELGRQVAADFSLGSSEAEIADMLPFWHGALCEQGRVWEVVCRFYAVNPAIGEDDVEKFRPWALAEIGEALAMSVGDVGLILDQARKFWARYRQARLGGLKAGTMTVRPSADVPVLDNAAIDVLLARYGFENEDARERRYIARRIEELETLLDSPQSWTLAISLIQQEVTISFGLDRAIAKIRQRQRDTRPDLSTKTDDEQLIRLTKARGDAQKAVEETQKMLGLNEDQTGTNKTRAIAQGTIGALLEAVRAYHARGDTSLVDGVFTALEVELLTTPFTLRPAQYRPDLVAMLSEATQMSALFDPEWKPPAFARKAVQRLRAGFNEGLARVRDENGEVIGELDEESAGEVVDRAVREGERGLAGMGMESAAAKAAMVSPAPPARSEPEPRRRGDNRLADF